MTAHRFQGVLQEKNPKKTQTPLYDRHITIGRYTTIHQEELDERHMLLQQHTDGEGETESPGGISNASHQTKPGTRIRLWVPVPETPAHQVGLFMAMSNAYGRTFSRSSPDELRVLGEWIIEVAEQADPHYLDAFHVQRLLQYYDEQILSDETYQKILKRQKPGGRSTEIGFDRANT